MKYLPTLMMLGTIVLPLGAHAAENTCSQQLDYTAESNIASTYENASLSTESSPALNSSEFDCAGNVLADDYAPTGLDEQDGPINLLASLGNVEKI